VFNQVFDQFGLARQTLACSSVWLQVMSRATTTAVRVNQQLVLSFFIVESLRKQLKDSTSIEIE